MRARTSTTATLAIVGLIGVGALGGCSSKTKAAVVTTTTSAADTTAATTTTEAPTTTVATDTSADTGGGTSTTLAHTGDGTDSNADTSVDTGSGGGSATSTDNSWAANATKYRGRNGLLVTYHCPANGTPSSIWGSGPFTDDSSVCGAAVFSGLIDKAKGGTVVIKIVAGQQKYDEGTAHGITTTSYGTWTGSFRFPAAG